MNRTLPVGCLTISFTLFALFGCGNQQAQEHADALLPVSSYQVATRDIPETVLLPGRIVSADEVTVSATMPGQLQQVHAQVGEPVAAGQLLATLNSQATETALQEAQKTLRALEQQMSELRSFGATANSGVHIDRLKRQIEQQIRQLTSAIAAGETPTPEKLSTASEKLLLLQKELVRMETESTLISSLLPLRTTLLQGLQLQVAQANRTVQAAQAQVDASRIRSPINGILLTNSTAPGSSTLPGAPLFQVGQVERLELELLVDPNIVTRLTPGQQTTVQIGSLPATTTKLSSVSPALQPQAKSFTARAPISNENGLFKPGMIGQAVISLASHAGVNAVPKAAILTDQAGSYVLRIIEGKATATRITCGYDDGTWVEIRSGLQRGDQVVHQGIERVQPGAEVKVVQRERGR